MFEILTLGKSITDKHLLFAITGYIVNIERAPTPKWMLPKEDYLPLKREAPIPFADVVGIIFLLVSLVEKVL